MRFTYTPLLILIAITPYVEGRAQIDTVRFMHYNLLNYGNSNAANRPSVKNVRLATIIQYVQPDLLSVNEMFSDSTLRDSLLGGALGMDWENVPYSNLGGATQTNTLFFKSALFRLRNQTVVSHNLRDIIAYRFQCRDTVTHAHDTIFFTAIVCHLKASDGSADEAERAVEASTIAAYLNGLGAGNYILAGDMNVYYSAEPAYQNLIANPNLSGRLYDPISRPGYWHADNTFADIHTQSPRNSNLGDGGVAGGLDDRFDQILVSGQVMNDGAGMKYLPGSYKAVGQDGQHFNAALVDPPTNTSAPAQVIQALHLASDHLPVTADFILHTTPLPTGVAYMADKPISRVTAVNPVGDILVLHFPEEMEGQTVHLQLHSMMGHFIVQTAVPVHAQMVSVPVADIQLLPHQLYILAIRNEAGEVYHIRLQKGG